RRSSACGTSLTCRTRSRSIRWSELKAAREGDEEQQGIRDGPAGTDWGFDLGGAEPSAAQSKSLKTQGKSHGWEAGIRTPITWSRDERPEADGFGWCGFS